MKQFTSTHLTSSLSEEDLLQLQKGEIKAVYIGSLPPRIDNLHGGAIDLFFGKGSFSIGGEIVQVGYKEEAFYVGIGDTLHIDHWRKEMVQQSGRPVIESIDVLSSWREKGLIDLITGPRKVRLYVRNNLKAPVDDRFFLKGIELISEINESHRVAFVASENDPGDIIVLMGGGHESVFNDLRLI